MRRQLRTPEVRLLWVHACALLLSTTSGSPRVPLLCRCCGERVVCSTADDTACSVHYAQLGQSGSVSVPVAMVCVAGMGPVCWNAPQVPYSQAPHWLALLFKLVCGVLCIFCLVSRLPAQAFCWEPRCEAAGVLSSPWGRVTRAQLSSGTQPWRGTCLHQARVAPPPLGPCSGQQHQLVCLSERVRGLPQWLPQWHSLLACNAHCWVPACLHGEWACVLAALPA